VVRLIDSLTMVLPFDGREKQMLLETVDAEQRLQSFIALIDGKFNIPDSATRH
jgi:Lon protease-like protein